MDFGIADLHEKIRTRYTTGEFVHSGFNPEGEERKLPTRSDEEISLRYGNGCWRHPADPEKDRRETGCFTCTLGKCGWDSSWADLKAPQRERTAAKRVKQG